MVNDLFAMASKALYGPRRNESMSHLIELASSTKELADKIDETYDHLGYNDCVTLND